MIVRTILLSALTLLLALGPACDNKSSGGAPWYDPPPSDAELAKKDQGGTAPDLQSPVDAPAPPPDAPVTVNQDGPATVKPDLRLIIKPDLEKVLDQQSGTPVDGPAKPDAKVTPPPDITPPDLPPWAGWDFVPIPHDLLVPDLPPPDLPPPDQTPPDLPPPDLPLPDIKPDSKPKPDAKPKTDAKPPLDANLQPQDIKPPGSDAFSELCTYTCDCVAGKACKKGVCVYTSPPTYCCAKTPCPAYQACEHLSGLPGFCPGGGSSCTTHCDCLQGDTCVAGYCYTLMAPTYCCVKWGCPAKSSCFTWAGKKSTCP